MLSAKEKSSKKSPLILLVEDQPEHVRFTKYFLQKKGYDVITTPSAPEAVKLAKRSDFDLILLDVMLADGSGIDVCEKIRRNDRLKNVPIIMLTSRGDLADKLKSFEAGADDYIVKPFQLEELLARVELLIRTKELRESEERYRDLVENLQDLVFIIQPDGTIRGVNRKTEELLDQKRDIIIGTSFHDFVYPDFRNSFEKLLRIVEKEDSVKGAYLKIVMPGRRIIPVRVNASAMRVGGWILQIRLIMRDVTEEERLEAEIQHYTRLLEEKVADKTRQLNATQQKLILAEKTASLGQLAAGVAHELRNPLNIIGTSIYYLSKVIQNGNKKVQEHLEIIQSEIERAQRIVTNLLNFSRKSSDERETVDVNRILNNLITLIEKDLRNSDIELQLDLKPVPYCLANIDDLKQIFLNLIINAKEAMANGGILSISIDYSPEGWVLVEISDTGAGIPKEIQPKIFDPFFTTKGEMNGTGLGLSIVQSGVRRNKGEIDLESEPGEGTTFTIRFPAK
ncbi:sensor protein ZraS [bacterium BMS3Abin05]|nr:sensor protein ZraS [bacterium BMS3Abin05]GBE27583.1 sensor protein ZraS [bacterium BMS3Bbin03]